MAIRVTYGTSDDFNNGFYQEKSQETLDYLRDQFSEGLGGLTEAGRRFQSRAKELFETFDSSEAMRRARASVRKVKSIFQKDVICSIWDLGKMQQAPLTMQRYIMAQPTVRRRYQEQRCDGYSGTYFDTEPGKIGEDHYDYRRVMDGIVVDNEDGTWGCDCYIDDLKDGDVELDIDQQGDILSTWAFAEFMIKHSAYDPVSPSNERL